MSEQVMTVTVAADDWNRLNELKTKRSAINKEIALLEDGMAILIVTHSAEQARRLAHRSFRLEQGRLSTT